MSAGEFALPAVEEALKPYIKPRNEVAAIRRDLQGYLQGQLLDDSRNLGSTNLHVAHSANIGDPPTPLSGVRKAYWKALQAHAAAQAKYEALKAELQHVRSQSSNPIESKSESVSEHYVSLLRERERQRKLQTLDQAVTQVSSVAQGVSSRKLDDVVEQQIGDLPAPPETSLNHMKPDSNIQPQIMELKKAILSTKQGTDKHKEKIETISKNDSHNCSSVSQSHGLKSALDELTAWMESQLKLINNSEADNEVLANGSSEKDQDSSEAVSLEQINDLYTQYIAARKMLIETISHPTGLSYKPPAPAATETPESKESSDNTTLSEILLPHISNLTSTKQREQALLQQSAYVRRQGSNAETETSRTIARLADESHIVHPGATKGEDWKSAGAEADQATKKYVEQRIETGTASMTAARKAMSDIESVPVVFEQLSGQR